VTGGYHFSVDDETKQAKKDAIGERSVLNALRRQCERGTFSDAHPQQREVQVKTLLQIATTSPYEKNRIAAMRVLLAMDVHNLNTLLTLTRIDAGNLGGNEDDIIQLPSNGPWHDTKAIEESVSEIEEAGEGGEPKEA